MRSTDMRKLFQNCRAALTRFRRSEDGLLSVEAALCFPLLFTGLIISYSYFTAFEAKGRANKAAYTLSDYVTRQTEAVTPDFIEGLADIYAFLNNDGMFPSASRRCNGPRSRTKGNTNLSGQTPTAIWRRLPTKL